MRCQFCHNPDTWDAQSKVPYEWTPQELLDEVRRYRSFIRRGGVTLTGGEPLVQAEFAREFFRLCRADGFHTALDTSGAVLSPTALEAVAEADLVMLDVKTVDDTLHKAYTGLSRANNHAFMEHLQAIGKTTWVRHVITPGITDQPERLTAVAGYVAQYSVVERVELLPYHTMGAYKYEKLGLKYPLEGLDALSSESLERARRIFTEKLSCEVV